ncbi:uncharacterized protein LOC143458896 isoform X2 [Clavelina lepadiformis]|uniref:uncharacterized protein LOC143458896 isoform X2 n=1 Tax=Clavelina lepadiformis TaxID=159417 RepID=UPI0040422374
MSSRLSALTFTFVTAAKRFYAKLITCVCVITKQNAQDNEDMTIFFNNLSNGLERYNSVHCLRIKLHPARHSVFGQILCRAYKTPLIFGPIDFVKKAAYTPVCMVCLKNKDSVWTRCTDYGCKDAIQTQRYRCSDQITKSQCTKTVSRFCNMATICDGTWLEITTPCSRNCIESSIRYCMKNGKRSSNCDKSKSKYYLTGFKRCPCEPEQSVPAPSSPTSTTKTTTTQAPRIIWSAWTACKCVDGKGETKRLCEENCPSKNSVIEVKNCDANCNISTSTTVTSTQTTSTIIPVANSKKSPARSANQGEGTEGKPEESVETTLANFSKIHVNWWSDKAMITSVGGILIFLLIIIIVLLYINYRKMKKKACKKFPNPSRTSDQERNFQNIGLPWKKDSTSLSTCQNSEQKLEPEYAEMLPPNHRLSCPELPVPPPRSASINRPVKPPRRNRPSEPNIQSTFTLPVVKPKYSTTHLIRSAPSSLKRDKNKQSRRPASADVYLKPIKL